MPASPQDKFKKVGANTVTSLAAPGKNLAATSINVGATTNYPTDTGLVIGIRIVDSNGNAMPGTYTEWNGMYDSPTSLTIENTPVYGTDQVYGAGATTQVFLMVSSSLHNQMVDGLLVSHDQDGKLKAGAISNSNMLANNTVTTPAITDASVTAAKIAPGALILGFAEASDTKTFFSTPVVVVTVSVTIPTGVSKVEVFAEAGTIQKNAVGLMTCSIKKDATILRTDSIYGTAANLQTPFTLRRFVDVTPGDTNVFAMQASCPSDTGSAYGHKTISVRVVA